MSLLGSAAETILTMTATGFACWKGEDLLIRLGWMKSPLGDETAPITRPPTVAGPIDIRRLLLSEEQERLMAQSFIDHPAAFWLDPNLWGDDPNWRERLFPPAPPSMRAHVEKRKSGDEKYAALRAAGVYIPEAHFRAVMGHREDTDPRLPCGCLGPVAHVALSGFSYTVCGQCRAEWEPASNDPTGRRLGQGERVRPAGYFDKVMSGLVQNADGTWRMKLSSAEIKARREATKRERLAKRDDYDNEMPSPPRRD